MVITNHQPPSPPVGWAWTDGSALGYVNWADGEPGEAFKPGEVGEEGCVELNSDGRWNDINCLQKRGFACRHLQRQHARFLLDLRIVFFLL